MKRKTLLLTAGLLLHPGCTQNNQHTEGDTTPTAVEQGLTLQIATLQGNVEAIQQLLEAGRDLNAKDQFGNTPLVVAATFGETEAAHALIDAGADLEIPNNGGSTPLAVAAFFCREAIVEALLAKGANKAATNNRGRTPLQSVEAPFEDVKPIYDRIRADLAPLGFELDDAHLKATRPKIAQMLR